MQDVFVDTGDVDEFIADTENLFFFQVNKAMEIEMNVSSLPNHALANFLYQEVKSDLTRAESSVQTSMKYLNGQEECVNRLQAKYNVLNVSDLLLQLREISYLINTIDYLTQDIFLSLSELFSDRASIINDLFLTNNSVLGIERSVAHSQMLLLIASGDVQALALIIGDLPGTGSGDSGSGDLSGSGIDYDEPLMVAPMTVTSVDQGLSNLRYTAEELMQLIHVHRARIIETADTSPYLQATAMVNQ